MKRLSQMDDIDLAKEIFKAWDVKLRRYLHLDDVAE